MLGKQLLQLSFSTGPMQKNRLNDAKNSRRDRLAARSMRQFSMAFGLYLLWAAIVWLAIAAGQLSLSSQATLILFQHIFWPMVTLDFCLARPGPDYSGTDFIWARIGTARPGTSLLLSL